MPPAPPRELIQLLVSSEISDNLAAQNEYISAKAMQSLGFSQKYVKRHLVVDRETTAQLKNIGRKME